MVKFASLLSHESSCDRAIASFTRECVALLAQFDTSGTPDVRVHGGRECDLSSAGAEIYEDISPSKLEILEEL